LPPLGVLDIVVDDIIEESVDEAVLPMSGAELAAGIAVVLESAAIEALESAAVLSVLLAAWWQPARAKPAMAVRTASVVTMGLRRAGVCEKDMQGLRLNSGKKPLARNPVPSAKLADEQLGEAVMARWAYAIGVGLGVTVMATATMGASATKPLLHISSHLAKAARVSVDGRAAVTAPGYGSVNTPVAAGKHSLKVTAPGGVSYTGALTLAPSSLLHWHGHDYWCVNLLKDQLEPYSHDECQEEVTDAG
jgi:hypothetical protein